MDGVNVQLGIWTMSCRNSTNEQVLDCAQAGGVNGTIARNGTYQHTYTYTLRYQSWVEYVFFVVRKAGGVMYHCITVILS